MSATLDLAQDLIRCRSVTPADAGCLDLLGTRLAALGFKLERLRYGEVDNLWATRGTGRPCLALAGHTDVVPTGPLEQWHSDPFEPTIRAGMLYGRGAADMKGALAAMVTAVERFVGAHPGHCGTLAFLLTSDEEGAGIDGTAKVVEELMRRGCALDYCLIGEPSSAERLGDVVRNGRRGSLTGRLTVRGIQGHVAYPDRARNPVHTAAPAIAELCATRWDEGSADFPPTSFQISNIGAGTGADNVIPGHLEVLFNFRFSTAVTADDLKARVGALLERHGLDASIQWRLSGEPFLTRRGALLDAVRATVAEIEGIRTEPSTGGGTSDGRFIARTGAEVIELGPVNASIHKIDEHVAVAELDRLSAIYEGVIARLLGAAP
ncbi:MAG: succinyl-diaminopimelate desuccinylase [Gammaproteobacteria bacterium]